MTPAVADAGCLVAVVGHTEAARVTAHALHQAAHRGAAGSSVAVADGVRLRCVTSQGAPHPPLTAEQLRPLVGGVAVGCLHDGDRGDALVTGHASVGQLLAAVVGRFTNGSQLRTELLEAGAVLRSGSDAELLLHLVARSSQRTFVNRLVDAVWRLEGAYSLVVGTPERLVVLRDPHGVRPLWHGHLGDTALLSTDDRAIHSVGGRLVRQLRPGEMAIIDDRGMQTLRPLPVREPLACTQELLTMALAGGRPYAEPVHGLRVRLGAVLAERHPVPEAEVVVGMPGTGEEYAVGFAAASRQPLEHGLTPAELPISLDPSAPQADPGAEDVLILRPEFDPVPHLLAPGDAAFLAALAEGAVLADAAEAGTAQSEAYDPTPILTLLMQNQALTPAKEA